MKGIGKDGRSPAEWLALEKHVPTHVDLYGLRIPFLSHSTNGNDGSCFLFVVEGVGQGPGKSPGLGECCEGLAFRELCRNPAQTSHDFEIGLAPRCLY